ncbi:MAG TPA: hypothetical protein VF144_05010 [Chitinophagaceae bacterium]
MKVLVYFDYFRYPLTYEEIKSFVESSVEKDNLLTKLDELLKSNKIFKLDKFYSLQNDRSLVTRRNKGNQKAVELMIKAEKISTLLYKFPYVRAIGISGSVSKYFADDNADIDYFIITKANRLWIARTLLHLFKKNPFLKNRKEYYCMNYFIDEVALVIEEKNIYTATELCTLIPTAGNGIMKSFFESNSWAHKYFPNRSAPLIKEEAKKSSQWLKKFIESMLNNKLGDSIDDYFMKLTTKRWKRKEAEKRLNTKGERMGLKTGKHFSKPNPIFFHDWFITKYEKNLEQKKREWQLADYVENHL